MIDMTGTAYVGDVGSVILIETNLDLKNATMVKINVYTPNKDKKVWNAKVDITNSKFIRYIVQSGDFSIPGTYYLQPEVTVGGFTGKGETIKLIIKQSFT